MTIDIPKGTQLRVVEKTADMVVFELPDGHKLTVYLGKGGDGK